jgi:nitroimidazol reductase NimA-like FMN-containing flavoprotein (pyridoxamine 5'-phosphate oxidase superfamily)
MAKARSRTDVRRKPERARYEREAIDAILDEAPFCHVGFVDNSQPFVIPMIHARVSDILYLHGSPAGRLGRLLASAAPICVTATILDGLVLARSAPLHSMNYRSAVVLGRPRLVDDQEKLRALEAVVDHVLPGRRAEVRPPSERELKQTQVVALEIDEASAKIRSGPPNDRPDDIAMPVWAGVIPLDMVAGDPIPADDLPDGIGVPSYVTAYPQRAARRSGKLEAR